ncbi:GntR family transcriptional regulator [Rhodoligotrophos appendicifer]|uniref:GntR family transcriptional regulator n=1 Tax=Rhodoligotrophos appendicifer TaxID=987056 RepID=UPI00117FCB32|nr:GntR family transcriptional regulator [Rhodoligotrophos appendicifer]
MMKMPSAALQPGPVTLYAQLARILRDRIYSGVWKDGEEIPTLEQLALQYNVARVTVRQAIQMLSNEGLLSSQRGRRTFVTYQVSVSDGRPLFSSIGAVEIDAAHYGIEILEKEQLETIIHPSLSHGTPHGPYMRVRKLDSERDNPYSLSENYVALDIYKKFPKGAERRVKIVRLVREHADPKPVSAFERISVDMPEYEEARLLKISSSLPVARLSRVFLDANNRILLFGTYTYRGDRFGIERDISNFVY